MCDEFVDGAYVPEQNKILLCANTMMRKKDFDNGLQRLLVLMYDNVRGNG